MSILVVNLPDSIATCDTIVVKLAKGIEFCQPIVKEAETNCNDVMIVVSICVTIVLIAFIAWGAVWCWQRAKINSENTIRVDKKTKDEAESKRKKERDLLDKLLSFLESNTKEDGVNEKKEKIKTQKGLASDESRYYIDVLRVLINNEKIPKYPHKPQVDES